LALCAKSVAHELPQDAAAQLVLVGETPFRYADAERELTAGTVSG
jgi:hypothetical protein